MDTQDDQQLLDAWHKYAYENNNSFFWFGLETLKYPRDFLALQEVIYATQPHVIIETGTLVGGTTLFLAMLLDYLPQEHGRKVISVDIKDWPTVRPVKPNIYYVHGSSVNPAVVDVVRDFIKPKDRVMVILDSWHHRDHVFQEMEAYGQLVTPGCYMLVEDTDVNGHPVVPQFGPGPMEAVEQFLPNHPEFTPDIDFERENLKVTFHPKGWLRKAGNCGINPPYVHLTFMATSDIVVRKEVQEDDGQRAETNRPDALPDAGGKL